MPKVNIYGLPPKSAVNTKVIVFDECTFNSSNAIRLFEGESNEMGLVVCQIPKNYIGKKIRLVAMPDMFNYIGEPLDVTPLGVFHTVSLSRDMGLYSGTEVLPIDPTSWRREAQAQMRRDFRAARHKNWMCKGLYWTLTLGSPILGLILAGPAGVGATLKKTPGVFREVLPCQQVLQQWKTRIRSQGQWLTSGCCRTDKSDATFVSRRTERYTI